MKVDRAAAEPRREGVMVDYDELTKKTRLLDLAILGLRFLAADGSELTPAHLDPVSELASEIQSGGKDSPASPAFQELAGLSRANIEDAARVFQVAGDLVRDARKILEDAERRLRLQAESCAAVARAIREDAGGKRRA